MPKSCFPMLKQLLIGGSLSALTLLMAAPAIAQAPAPAPETPAQEIPEPEAPVQEAPQAEEVGEAELEQFVNAAREVQTIQQESRVRSVEVIENEGLTTERFNEILTVQQDPAAAPVADVGDDELENFERALIEIADIQQGARIEMQEAIQAEGMDVERFNEILALLRENPDLQAEVERILTN